MPMTLAYERLVPTQTVNLIATLETEVLFQSYCRETVRRRRGRGTAASQATDAESLLLRDSFTGIMTISAFLLSRLLVAASRCKCSSSTTRRVCKPSSAREASLCSLPFNNTWSCALLIGVLLSSIALCCSVPREMRVLDAVVAGHNGEIYFISWEDKIWLVVVVVVVVVIIVVVV